MRESFNSIGQLIGLYRFIRMQLFSCQSSAYGAMKRLYVGDIDDKRYGKITQGTMEEKLSFIADVESFCLWYALHGQQKKSSPLNKDVVLHIFHLKFCPDTARYQGYRHMAACLRRDKTNTCKRLHSHAHIQREGEIMSEYMEKYFVKRGMVQ